MEWLIPNQLSLMWSLLVVSSACVYPNPGSRTAWLWGREATWGTQENIDNSSNILGENERRYCIFSVIKNQGTYTRTQWPWTSNFQKKCFPLESYTCGGRHPCALSYPLNGTFLAWQLQTFTKGTFSGRSSQPAGRKFQTLNSLGRSPLIMPDGVFLPNFSDWDNLEDAPIERSLGGAHLLTW